jgi:hypothetical protein
LEGAEAEVFAAEEVAAALAAAVEALVEAVAVGDIDSLELQRLHRNGLRPLHQNGWLHRDRWPLNRLLRPGFLPPQQT